MSYTEKDKERKQQYYLENREKILEYSRQYKQSNKDYIKEYHEKNKDIKKEYYQNNKEKILERAANYKKENYDKIKERASEKIMCACGCELRRDKMTKHQTSKKHIKKVM